MICGSVGEHATMNVPAPHFLLVSESSQTTEPGRWRFVLRAADGSQRMVADDVEPDSRGERLELLTVVRGLEALDQPSRVTLMTPSAYVREGIRYGLMEWRRNGWRWECFGRMVPVKHCDLWRRVDRALGFHHVECRTWRFDPPHPPSSMPGAEGCPGDHWAARYRLTSQEVRSGFARLANACRRRMAERLERWKCRAANLWTTLVSCV
jgi:ribonuclease HI